MTVKPCSRFARSAAYPLLIAHRGGSLEAPENTLGSLRHGIACGADWQEVDITLSSDGHAVIVHDDTLERTTNGVGEVSSMTLAQLTALQAGAPGWTDTARLALSAAGVHQLPVFGERFAQERLPALTDALALPGAQLMLELKTTANPHALARAVIEAVHKAGMQHRVALGSFDLATMAAIKQVDANLPRIGIAEKVEMFDALLALGVDILAIDTPLVVAAAAIAPRPAALWTWTVYTPQMARQLSELGADGLITDVPAQLIGARNAQAPQPD